MELTLKRKWFKDSYTIGKIFIGDVFFSDSLEDRYRALPEEQKVYGQTAVPFGRYRIVMSYSVRFGRLLPELLNVPYFEGIRIHSGNTSIDTEGCILVGKNDFVGGLSMSRYYSDLLNKKITTALQTGNVYLNIVKDNS